MIMMMMMMMMMMMIIKIEDDVKEGTSMSLLQIHESHYDDNYQAIDDDDYD